MPLRRDFLLASLLAALVAGNAEACPKHTSKSAAVVGPRPASAAALLAWKPRVWSPPAGAAQGLRVAIDPVDGAMGMPPADELPARSVVVADDAPVSIYRRADGSGRATLDERFADYAMVTLGADGKPAWTCVHGAGGAARFLQSPALPARPALPAPAPGTVWEEK